MSTREIFYNEAVKEAIAEEMTRDDKVILLGEDVAVYGGVYRCSLGLLDQFGPERIRDAPISEAAIVGAGIGASIQGMRPIVEIMYADFIPISMDQVINQAALIHFVSGLGGIGWVLAEAFAENGARLVLADIDPETLNRISRTLARKKTAALVHHMDVTQKSDIQTVFDAVIEKYRRIDVVVHTAGVAENDKAVDFSESEIDRILEINLKGTILINQTAGKIMARQGAGKIINIGSIGGLMAHTLRSMPYAASKAGVHQATRSFAAELADSGVNVNAVAPTWVNTAMVQGKDPAYYENINQTTPFGRMCEPSELVGAVVFLASPASDFITGQVIYVDGGWSISKAVS